LNAGEISLVVRESLTQDIGRGVARIDLNLMNDIGIEVGDTIEIKGKKTTVAKCLYMPQDTEDNGMIKIDGLIRNNAGVAISDTVSIRKIASVPAQNVLIAPLETVPPLDGRYVADALDGMPLVKGDNVLVPYFGGRLTFHIMGTAPSNVDAVIVTQKTVFQILDKPQKQTTRNDKIQTIVEKIINIDTLKEKEFDDLISGLKKLYDEK